MTPLTWIYMLSVWAVIIALNAYCFYRIFTGGRGPKGGGR